MSLPYEILWRSLLQKESLTISWSKTKHDLPQELCRAQERYWKTLDNELLYNGELVRLDQWGEKNGLHLLLSITDYKSLLYSHAHAENIIREWGKEFISRALGVSAIVVSSDGYIFVMQNSVNVGEYPGYWDVPGGHVDLPVGDQIPDPFADISRELHEELALSYAINQLTCMGLIETKQTFKPELLFMANCEYDRRDILVEAENSKDKFEFSKLQSLAVDELEDWTIENINHISPSALAALHFYKDYVRRAS